MVVICCIPRISRRRRNWPVVRNIKDIRPYSDEERRVVFFSTINGWVSWVYFRNTVIESEDYVYGKWENKGTWQYARAIKTMALTILYYTVLDIPILAFINQQVNGHWKNCENIFLRHSNSLKYLIFRYHAFKNRPYAGTEFVMRCEPEFDNPYDRYAVKVVAPPPQEIRTILDMETRPPPRRQWVRDVAGCTVGRVPRSFCKLIWRGLQVTNTLSKAECIYTGDIIQDGSMRGGGPKLTCAYILTLTRAAHLPDVVHHLHMAANIPSDDIFCWSWKYFFCW